jgi:hypothetical protein
LTPPQAGGGEKGDTVGRWRLKHSVVSLLRDVPEGASTPGVCKCGMSGRDVAAVDLVRRAGGRPGVRGVVFCDSPWLCPTCAPKRAGERVERVGEVFDAAERQGGTVAFVTLTVRHERGQPLVDLKQLVQQACADARRGRPWALAKERFGIAGVLSSPEVTYGDRTGWHFHLHLGLVLLPGEDRPGPLEMVRRAEAAGEWLIERYMAYIRRAGGSCDRKGQDVQALVRREELAKYVGKGSADWEIAAAGATKLGLKGNTPWDLAARASRGDAVAANRFREYAACMPGTRACIVTPTLAAALGIEPADDGDQPGEEEVREEEHVLALETGRWNRLLRRGCAPDVLGAVADGQDGQAIDVLVSELLGEERASVACMSSTWPKPPPRRPSALALARQARQVQIRRSARTSPGAALQIVVKQIRDAADRRGEPALLPDLGTTMRLLTDGLA